MQYTEPTDLVKETNDLKAHTQWFILWPRQWAMYRDSHKWQIEKLKDSRASTIPNKSGIYTLLLRPGIAGHQSCSYLMYVGKAKSLRARFRDYLRRERREMGRPKIVYFLNKYDEYIWFCFTRARSGSIGNMERGLISAYLPPLNDQIEGFVGRAVRAF